METDEQIFGSLAEEVRRLEQEYEAPFESRVRISFASLDPAIQRDIQDGVDEYVVGMVFERTGLWNVVMPDLPRAHGVKNQPHGDLDGEYDSFSSLDEAVHDQWRDESLQPGDPVIVYDTTGTDRSPEDIGHTPEVYVGIAVYGAQPDKGIGRQRRWFEPGKDDNLLRYQRIGDVTIPLLEDNDVPLSRGTPVEQYDSVVLADE